jgi:hypothetical protein
VIVLQMRKLSVGRSVCYAVVMCISTLPQEVCKSQRIHRYSDERVAKVCVWVLTAVCLIKSGGFVEPSLTSAPERK